MTTDRGFYNDIRGGQSFQYKLIETPPTITDADKAVGVIKRYFARPSNLSFGEIYEINETTYNQLATAPIFKTLSISWKIKGSLDDKNSLTDSGEVIKLYVGVITANRNSIQQNEYKMPGLKDKLTNYTQYWLGY
jgi:hypothetical protein